MLGDEEWLAKHTESWRAALIDLRDRLNDELANHARGNPSEAGYLTSSRKTVKSSRPH